MASSESHDRSRWIRDALARFEGRLLRYAARLTGNVESGRDVVQETFLRLCRQQPEQIDGHLEPWLFTVCRRQALDVVQQQKRMPTVTDSSSPPQILAEPDQSSSPGPILGNIEQQETSAEIQQLLAGLSVNKQEVIRLKFQEGLSYKQISEVTGLTVSNLGYLLHTALAELRVAVEERK